MRTESVWAGQDHSPPKAAGISTTTCVLAVALAGTAVWSAVLWAYQFWLT
jgi:hypothetical protein